LAAFLRIPADRMISGAMMVGYPQWRYYRLPQRNALQVNWFAETANTQQGTG